MKTKILLSAIPILAVIAVQSQIIHIPDDQPTIQAGINVAHDGDTVLVSDGTYFENIAFMGKKITVASYFFEDQNPDHITNTIINGSQPSHADSGAVVMFCYEEDTTSVLCGFTITEGTGMYYDLWGIYGGGGIACWNAGAKIIHNNIIGNGVSNPSFAFGGGIACDVNSGEQWIVLEDNLIKNNSVHADGFIASSGGVYIGINARVCNNIIEENHCISANGQADAGGIRFDSQPMLLKAVIFNNNLVRNNSVQGSSAWGGGMLIYKAASVITNSTILGNTAEASFDGRGAGVFAYQTQGSLIITGNSISNNALISNNEAWGSGISITNSKERIIIEHNMIMDNTIFSTGSCSGAGVDISYPLIASPINISHNQISGNASISMGSFEDGSFGGGVGLILETESEVTFDGNMIIDNRARSGGGLYLQDVYNIDITNNVFACDTALSYGGAICVGLPVPSASDESKKQKNSAQSGKSEDLPRDAEHPFLANNTFSKNRGFMGGAVYSNNGNLYPVIINSIFWENNALDGHAIYQLDSPDLPVYYCNIDPNDITGQWSGDKNITVNPSFIDPENGNYCIDSCASQCAGTGIDSLYLDNLGWYIAPGIDINGNARPMPESQLPDMGAYEVDLCTGFDDSKFQVSSFKFQIYPNPSFGISDIKYQISDIRFVSLEVFDIHGQRIGMLVDEMQGPGHYVIRFDGTRLSAGVYSIRLKAGSVVHYRKLILL